MDKLSLAWVEAQIERERERGCNPSAVRDLASLVIVRDYLSGGQYAMKPLEAMGMMLPFAMGQGMRDHNEIAIGEYKDQRTGAPEKTEHHREEHHYPEGDAHHMGAYPMMEQMHHDHHTPLDKETVMAWVDGMVDGDGVHGGKYSWHQAQQYAMNKGITGHQRQLEFYAAMNAMYSDFHEAGKKFGCDRPEFYACLAKLFIEDPDAVEDKVSAYYHHVVKHDT